MKEILALDTEGTGLGHEDRAIGISYCLTGYKSDYVDLRMDDPTELFNIITESSCPIVAHNASFDYRMTKRAGVELPIHRLDDTVIRATLINEHEFSYGLDDLAKKHLGAVKDREIYSAMAEIFGGRPTRSAQIARISEAPRSIVAPYAIQDAILCHDLWQWQEEEIERQGIRSIIDFERELMPTIIRREMAGIRVDVERAESSVVELTKIIDQQSHQLFEVVGKVFNINSAKDVATIFNPSLQNGQWVTMDGCVIPATPGGKPSFSADALREINNNVSRSIIELRSLEKTRDTFIKGHILREQVGGRVYPSIHQTKGEDGGTGTGRFAYSGPAMQQIPSRNKEVAAVVKPIFLPEEGQVWVDADKHSFEVRVFAHLVNDPEIISKYEEDPESDFHQMVADMTGLPRNAKYSGQANAKQLNLSMIFNSGNGAIAEKMGMPFTWDSFMTRDGTEIRYKKAGAEAMAVINAYHNRLPGIKKLADRAKRAAEAYGYIQTKFGRRLRFPRKFKTYKASGLAIQATAADINKKNWMIIEEALGSEGSLILNTHDSYSMSLPEDWEPHWKKVKQAVESGHDWFRVPLILELSGAGPNWWAALGK